MKFNFKLHCNCARCLRGLSLGVFQEMKPCFARRARQDTCRCRYCDDMSLMLKTLRKNSHLLRRDVAPSTTRGDGDPEAVPLLRGTDDGVPTTPGGPLVADVLGPRNVPGNLRPKIRRATP